MALTDGEGMNTTMLVSPNGTSNGGMFGGGDSWAWIILLLLLGWGNNGWGGNNGNGANGLYPWMNQADLTNGGFRDQMLNSNIAAIQSGVNGISTQLCNGFAGVNATVNAGFAGAEASANARQIANMQTAFAGQTAINQGFNAVQGQLAQCCCDNRAGLADLKYTVATENCADRSAISDGIRDLLAATQAQTQTILNQLCSDKIEQKNDTINQLRSELLYARGQASQDVQTAVIQAGQRALANEVEQYVAPKPIPAYYVQNPNCCGTYTGCGCNA